MNEQIGDKIAGSGPEISLHPQTLDEAIERWDKGESLFTVEMGGLGPGHEQALQIADMELIRGFKDKEINWAEVNEDPEPLNKEMDEYMWADPTIKKLGFSGAQAGAAKYIASVFIRNGWEKGLEMAPKDRHIQISKNFPS